MGFIFNAGFNLLQCTHYMLVRSSFPFSLGKVLGYDFPECFCFTYNIKLKGSKSFTVWKEIQSNVATLKKAQILNVATSSDSYSNHKLDLYAKVV